MDIVTAVPRERDIDGVARYCFKKVARELLGAVIEPTAKPRLDAIDAIFALPPDLPVLAERDDGPLAQVRAVDEVDVLRLLAVRIVRAKAAIDEPLLRERVDCVVYCMYSLERLLVFVPDKLDGIRFLPTAERL